eukprot:2263956-Pleurochrysis_carterae.AAC.1
MEAYLKPGCVPQEWFLDLRLYQRTSTLPLVKSSAAALNVRTARPKGNSPSHSCRRTKYSALRT